MAFVEIKNLTKYYGELCAVDHLNISVEEGEIFGLIGPNGAGKSTTLHVITTLTDFDKGEVIIDGLDLRKDKVKIKQLIGMVPQDIAVYDHLTALENVKFFASLYGLRGKELTKASKEALDFVGLSDRLSLKPKHMSGGMKRRLNIACGIAHGPKFIVMDEPTVGVDAQSREHILNSIQILRERGATVIYTSHYMNEVEIICNRIAIIDKGKLVASGTKHQLVSLVTDVQSVYIHAKLPMGFLAEDFMKRLRNMPDVKAVSMEDYMFRIDIIMKENGISRIVEQFIQQGISIISIKSEEPDLDTMFLTLTGHDLR